MRRFRRIASLVNAGDLIQQVTQLNTREEYVAWEQRRAHRISERAESCQTLTIIDWQETISDHMSLESLKDSVRGRFVHVSAAYKLRWREIETAFESCILIGAVINSNYIEL